MPLNLIDNKRKKHRERERERENGGQNCNDG